MYAILCFGNYEDVEEEAAIGGRKTTVVTRVYHTDPRLTLFLWIPAVFIPIFFFLCITAIEVAIARNQPPVIAFFLGVACGLQSLYCMVVYSQGTRFCHPSSRVWIQFIGAAIVLENTLAFHFPGFTTFVAIPGGQVIRLYTTCEQGKYNTLSSNMRVHKKIEGVEEPVIDTTLVYLSINFAIRVDVFNHPWRVQQTLYHDFIFHPDDHLSARLEREGLGLIISTCDRTLQHEEADLVRLDVNRLNDLLRERVNEVMRRLGFEVLEVSIDDYDGVYLNAIEQRADAEINRETQTLVSRRNADAAIAVATAQADAEIQTTDQNRRSRVQTAEYNKLARQAELLADKEIAKTQKATLDQQIQVAARIWQQQNQDIVQHMDAVENREFQTIMKDLINRNAKPEDLDKALQQLKDFIKVPERVTLVDAVQPLINFIEKAISLFKTPA
ncbi:MAG TPA: hypothetical protein VHA78_05645 [Candidatus Peribacteraceae bacterium]|nr:hypothetical protein [Candidatus Peribacteraceae bacterium]